MLTTSNEMSYENENQVEVPDNGRLFILENLDGSIDHYIMTPTDYDPGDSDDDFMIDDDLDFEDTEDTEEEVQEEEEQEEPEPPSEPMPNWTDLRAPANNWDETVTSESGQGWTPTEERKEEVPYGADNIEILEELMIAQENVQPEVVGEIVESGYVTPRERERIFLEGMKENNWFIKRLYGDELAQENMMTTIRRNRYHAQRLFIFPNLPREDYRNDGDQLKLEIYQALEHRIYLKSLKEPEKQDEEN